MDWSILMNPEYQFLQDNEYLGGNIILLGLGGSHAYGTNVETSDLDIRGVATRTPYSIFTGHDFEEVVNNATDTTIYSFDKMIKLLAECNPNCIEILGLRKQDYFRLSPAGQDLLDNTHLFLSQHCIKTFGGYANQQLYRLQQKTLVALSPSEFNSHIAKTISGMSDHLKSSWGIEGVYVREESGKLVVDFDSLCGVPLESFYGLTNEIGNVVKEYNKESKRNNKAIEHGKINKHAMHLIRLYMMCIDILEDANVVTYRAAEHDLLMDIRNGKFMGEDGLLNKDFFNILKEYEAKFEEAKKTTKLPEHPDYKAIKDFQNRINRQVVVRE